MHYQNKNSITSQNIISKSNVTTNTNKESEYIQKINEKNKEIDNINKNIYNLNSSIKNKNNIKEKETNKENKIKLEKEIKTLTKTLSKSKRVKLQLENEIKTLQYKLKEIQQNKGANIELNKDKNGNPQKTSEIKSSSRINKKIEIEKKEGTGSNKKKKDGKSEIRSKEKKDDISLENNKIPNKLDSKKDTNIISEINTSNSKLVKQLEDTNIINLNNNFDNKKMGGNSSSQIDELNKQKSDLIRQINDKDNYLEKLKNENKIQIDELKKENDLLKKENEKLRIQLDELKKFKEKIDKERKNSEKYNPENKFDIALKVDSLRTLTNGWKIQFSDEYTKKSASLKNEKILKIGLLGLKNSGKSFVLSKLLYENPYDKSETDNLYLRFVKEQKKTLAFIDPPGFGRAIKKIGNFEIKEGNKYEEDEKNNEQTDNFLVNFIIKNSDFLIVVVGALNIYEQKLILKLKSKDLEHKEAFSKLKRIFVVHNLKEFSKKEEVKDHIKNIILNSKTFALEEKETQLTQKIKDNTKNTKYLIEEHENKEIEIYHLILAKDKSEAGNYYNEFTYNLIISQFNYFFGNSGFDLVNEIKKELITISDKIFIKPLKSLEDFESTPDIIKVKKEHAYISKSGDNTDFSFLKLKPKYSYFKVENNTKLLIVIEMPGNIMNQKLSCSSPKNGYYSITFSGKKVLNYPEIPEKDKKEGLFYNNREEGEFKEVFKIKQTDFMLSSYKCIKEEKEDNGVYKYYFKLISDDSDED